MAGGLLLSAAEARIRARFYDGQAVVKEQYTDDGRIILTIDMPRADFMRLISQAEIDQGDLIWLSGGPNGPDNRENS